MENEGRQSETSPSLPSADVGSSAGAHPARLAPGLAPTLRAGEVLAGRYQVLRFLARGGMGEVYEAKDLELGVAVALKTLRPALARARSSLRSFKREVLLARSVSHPGICRIYDFGRDDASGRDLSFLTMELLRGASLRERLGAHGRIAPDEALPLARQIAEALDAAHRAGVLHRDFKSANIMLVAGEGGDRAIVTDFGLAHALAPDDPAETSDGRPLGTPAYMSPEQVEGARLGPASDVYALGVVLFEMVTGELPFVGASPMATALLRLHAEPPSPRARVPELSERWEAAIGRCLARDPAARFARASDVAAALAGEHGLTAAIVRGSLPAERDAIVGRRLDLEELGTRLRGGERLVTLLGPAGTGKTRLALRFGWTAREIWPGGVWYCDLSEARSLDGVVAAVARSLAVPLGRSDPVVQLGHAIAGRGRTLLVLDNFEPVVQHAGATVGRWLERAKEARFLVTSRERLQLEGEAVQQLGPLAEDEALALFVERARAQRPGFAADAAAEPDVRRIVRHLEGLPLAIELAAARVRVLSPRQIGERLGDRFRLLAGAPEGGRHASLRAAFDGSWELLRPWEKAVFAQASVFEGGFTLEAAEAVLEPGAWPEPGAAGGIWVLDVMQALVDKSLLRSVGLEHADGEPRFEMLTSLKEYARGKLDEPGAIERGESGPEAARRAERRHARCFARLGADAVLEALHGRDGPERMRLVARELDNLVEACRRGLALGEAEAAQRSLEAVWAVVERSGPFVLVLSLARDLLASQVLGAGLRARVLAIAGRASWQQGRTEEARAFLEQAIVLAGEAGDRRTEGRVVRSLGALEGELGRPQDASRELQRALAIARELGDRRLEGLAFSSLGSLRTDEGRMDESLAHLERALEILRELGDRRTQAAALGNLGNLHAMQGRMLEAYECFTRALAVHRDAGDRVGESWGLGNRGALLSEQGRLQEAGADLDRALGMHRELGNRRGEGYVLKSLGSLGIRDPDEGRRERARANLEGAIEIAREIGDRILESTALGNLGDLLAYQGRPDEARACFHQALAIRREIGSPRGEGALLGRLGRLHAEEGRLEEARDAFARGALILREVGDSIELGKLRCAEGECERAAGELTAAHAALNEAEALAAVGGADHASDLAQAIEELRARLGGSTGS